MEDDFQFSCCIQSTRNMTATVNPKWPNTEYIDIVSWLWCPNTMCSFQCLNLNQQGDGLRYLSSEWKRMARPKTRRNPVHLEYVKFLNSEPKLYSHTTFPKTWFSGERLLYLQDLVFVEHLLDGTLNLYQAVLQSAALASQVQVLKPLFWWSTIGFILSINMYI